ncbi:hypothetical protein [Microbacterium sp. NPDC058345]|uniref:hypothetical protein n=1 Tax=Microbacterium sp. NPDC058345 TaxID=3346455 RepID=UPI00364E7B16
MPPTSTGRRVALTVVIVVLAVVVATLSVMALTSSRAPQSASTPQPIVSLTPQTTVTPTVTPKPTPTATATPAVQDRAAERFLSFAGSSGWRATAGSCGGDAPLLQRLDAQGAWVDVVPSDVEMRQIASVDAYPDGAELVASVDDECTAASLRTFSAGAEWTSYDGSLERSRYITLDDPALVHTRAGDLAAPCATPRGLRASGDVVALICDDQAWLLTESTWAVQPTPAVRALTIDSGDLVVGHVTAECAGLAVTRFSSGESSDLGCAENVDATQPIAMAPTAGAIVVWAGDSIVEVSAP